jgi:hypothetical protein
MRKTQETQVGLKLSGTHKLLIYADVANLLGANIDAIKRNRGTLIDPTKEVGLGVNTEKTKYVLMSRLQNSQIFGNESNKSMIREEMKSALNLGSSYCHSV